MSTFVQFLFLFFNSFLLWTTLLFRFSFYVYFYLVNCPYFSIFYSHNSFSFEILFLGVLLSHFLSLFVNFSVFCILLFLKFLFYVYFYQDVSPCFFNYFLCPVPCHFKFSFLIYFSPVCHLYFLIHSHLSCTQLLLKFSFCVSVYLGFFERKKF